MKDPSSYQEHPEESRFSAHNSKDFSNLTIWNVVQEDEGMYHCGIDTWIKLEWSGTYLLVKGNTERTSNYIVVRQPTESNPLRPGDTATLQCSVLTNSEKNTCSGHHNVFWFRDGSNKSLPNIIYTHGNRTDQCEQRSDPQDGCVYRFSKTVSSSDAGTYYCAVATCGEILFGNGTKLDVQEKTTRLVFIGMVILITCLAVSVIGNLFFICNRRVCKKCKAKLTQTVKLFTVYEPDTESTVLVRGPVTTDSAADVAQREGLKKVLVNTQTELGVPSWKSKEFLVGVGFPPLLMIRFAILTEFVDKVKDGLRPMQTFFLSAEFERELNVK
ncbi:signal-regulatory protein beta-2-like [Neolamprologus brichardi]|uniref:signal-regulatory protein beta-2-like n=1 Tax=Neolamprologus brichardi TaxID=32507 RepID=UPI0016438934|nr:signal-regulatory protein beta-2-like [Neolamprologus brichardi]